MNYKNYFETAADGNTTSVAFGTLLLHSSLFPCDQMSVRLLYHHPGSTSTGRNNPPPTHIHHLQGCGTWLNYWIYFHHPTASVILRICKKPQPVQVTVMTRTLALLLTPPLQPPASPQLSRLSSAHRRMSEVSASVCTSSLPVCC